MRKSDLIAIVGIGCRFPSAPEVDALWSLLCSGGDAIRGRYDDRRLDIDGNADADAEWVSRLRGLQAGLLDDIDAFDAGAFGISAREARLMDPQQRLMLQASWEALDDAGQDMRRLEGRKVGVYTGIYGTDYQHRLFRHFPDVDVSLTTGASAYALAGRISYAFGFQGPSFTIETACSSSLVAIHEACRALREGECELALAGGVNLLLDPVITLAYLNAGALSPDSRCKFGDASGDGYVRAEGVGMVALKTLDQAQADGDPIHAVIRSSAVAHTGQSSSSLFTPGEASQVGLFEEALARAGLTAADLDYIEAHGTGTKAGDRVELGAVSAVLANARSGRTRPCLVGSIKTNIGHTESAAGIAGVIKAVLCLKHGQVPPSLHFTTPNPNVHWDDELFRIPTAVTPIDGAGRPATVAVNSFGITGTIACVVLEAAPAGPAPIRTGTPTGDPFLLPLSARSPDALKRYAEAVGSRLRDGAATAVDIAYSAACKRTHHDLRLAAIGRTADEFADALESFVQDEPAPNLRASVSPVIAAPKVGWVFCGQGPQWANMGMELYAAEPVFRAKMDELDALIRTEAGFSVIEEIRIDGPASRLDRTDITQPAIFSLQIALAALLISWDLKPSMMVGHSVGEVAAALTAGVLTLEDAVRVICARGRITEKAAGWGKMAALELSVAEAEQMAAESGGGINVAAINSPHSVTLAGLREPLEEACERARSRGRFARMLEVDYPSHCALLDPLIPEMAVACAAIGAGTPATPLYSTVLGRRAALADFTAEYWTRNLREAVLFAPTIEGMAGEGCDLFVEIGPHPVLSYSIKQVLEACGSTAGVTETMRRDGDEVGSMRNVAAEHYVRGAEPDWSVLAPAHGSAVPLPPYPWDQERYWIEEPHGGAGVRRTTAHDTNGAHALLQRRLAILGAGGGSYWQSDIALARLPWVGDHRVRGRATFPAAGYIVAALAAGNDLAPGSSLADMEFHEALLVPDSGTIRLQFGFTADATPAGSFRLTVDAAPPDQPQNARTHVTGRIVPADESFKPARMHVHGVGVTTAQAPFYDAMTRAQLNYGALFQGVESIAVDGARAVATLARISPDATMPGLHPATVDACLQVLLALTPDWGGGELWLPKSIKRVHQREGAQPGAGLTALAMGMPSLLGQDFMGDVLLLDGAGEVLLSLEGIRFHKVAGADADTSLLHEVRWITQPRAPAVSGAGWMDAERVTTAANAAGLMPDERRAIARVKQASDRLGGVSVQHALRALAFDFTPGRRVGFDEVAHETGVLPEHYRLLRRLLAILCEDGILARDGDGWRVILAPAAVDLAAELDAEIASAEPNVAAFWQTFARASRNLAPVLCGAMEATELLFGNEGAALLEELYAQHLFWQAPIRQLAAAIASLIEQLPAGRTLRVLEIGAGTGGVTRHLLPLLPAQQSHYAFTDLSRYFFGPAQARFADYPFVSQQLLDIERDPLAQDFEADSFDVVVAANCLHATADLRRSLDHATRLLRPGGMLLLQEETASERWTDLIFGLTEGWWRFQDGMLRPNHALLSPKGWTELLADAGFDEPMVLGGRDGDPCGAVAIVARKHPAAATDDAPWLLLSDEGDVAGRLMQRLAQMGQPSRLGAATAADDAVRAYLAEPDSPGQVVVDLRPLDARLDDRDDIDALIRTESLALDRMLGTLHLLVDGGRHHPPRLALVTAGSQATGDDQGPVAMAQSTLWTIARNAALENLGTPIAAIDLDIGIDAEAIDRLASELLSPDGEPEVALRRGRRRVRRLFRWDQADPDQRHLPAVPFALETSQRGVLDGFEAVAMVPEPPKPGEVQIRIHATGINFRDLMNQLGAVQNAPLGIECSGIVAAIGDGVEGFAIGDAVMAAGIGTWRSHVNTPAVLVAPKPAGLHHEAAAAVPIVYLTAHYALRHLVPLAAGQRVLIHAAAGGFGLASLHIAQVAGAQVIATAGTEAKRDYLRSMGVIDALDSRSLSFADSVRSLDTGTVDVVVNSLAGDFIPASLDLLADGGTFIEVGKQDIWTHEQVAKRRPDVTYHVVDLEGRMRDSPEELASILPQIAAEIEQGVLPALPIRAFPMSHTLEALRFMQEARQTGKIVLTAPPAADAPAEGVALITGGLGGLGLAVARWLADKGHKQLILAGRSAPGDAAAALIDELRARDVQVWTVQCDMGEHAQVAQLIARCGGDLPPLKAVFHLAGLLDDAPVHQLETSRFLSVYRPKVFGAWSLHRLTKRMPLDQFVLFSSWTAVLGSPAQANHASANAFLDALAHHRRAQGLAAQSINWGGWGDTGSAADPVRLAHLARQGLGAMSNAVALEALSQVVSSDAIQVAVSPFDPAAWRAFAGASATTAAVAELEAPVADTPTIEMVEEPAPAHAPRLHEALGELSPGPARRTLIETQIKTRLSQVLRTPTKALDIRKSFKSLGLDSLTALELRNVLEIDTELKLPASLIFNHASIAKLGIELANRMGMPLEAEAPSVSQEPITAESDDVASLLDALQALPEKEALRLLSQEEAHAR